MGRKNPHLPKQKKTKKKKIWNKKSISKYFRDSDKLSDYTCPSRGIIE